MWLRDVATDVIVVCVALLGLYKGLAFFVDELSRRFAHTAAVTAAAAAAAADAAAVKESNVAATAAAGEEPAKEEEEAAELGSRGGGRGQLSRPWSLATDMQLFPIAVTLIFACWLAWMLVVGRSGQDADADRAKTQAEVLGPTYYTATERVPYLLLSRFATHESVPIPIVDCGHFTQASRVQTLVLDRAGGAGGGGGGKRGVALAANGHNPRLRAARRCALETEAQTLVSVIPSQERLADQPLFWALPALALANASDMAVTDVLVTPNRTVLLRVWMVRQAPGSATYRLLPTVIGEATLRLFAAEWYTRMQLKSRADGLVASPPCLCAEHLGIIGSGLLLHYGGNGKPWRVLLMPNIVYEVPGTEGMETSMQYNQQSAFPFLPNAAYAIDSVRHAGKVDVRYSDASALLATPAGEARLKSAEPVWSPAPSAGSVAADDTATLPLAVVVDLRALDPFPGGHQFTDFDNGCLQHCLEMRRRARAKLDGS